MSHFEKIKAFSAASNRKLLHGKSRFRFRPNDKRMHSGSTDFENLDVEQDLNNTMNFDDHNDDNGEEADQPLPNNESGDDDNGEPDPNSDIDAENSDDINNNAEDEVNQFGVRVQQMRWETDLRNQDSASNQSLTRRIMDIVYPRVEVLVRYLCSTRYEHFVVTVFLFRNPSWIIPSSKPFSKKSTRAQKQSKNRID